MTTQEVLQHFQNVKRTGNNQYSALCPAHDDHTASLCIGTGDDGRTLVTCQRGCSLDDILSAVGLKKSDLFATPLEQKQNKPWKYICSYYYPDRNGRPRNRKDRYIKPDGKKTFIWKHYDGKQWVKHKTNGDPGLYNADCISGNDLIYIVEGEKDVETLKACGRAAVCSPHGAKQNGEAWKPEYTEALKGKSVVVIQDNDETGKAFSSIICNALSGQVASVKLVDLCKLYPALKEHGDITDLCEINGGSNAIIEAVETMAAGLPEYQKQEPPADVFGRAEYTELQEPKKLSIISATDLYKADLPPVKFIVKDILPEGTGMVSAPSKTGKSWLVLDMGLSVSAGIPFMGYQTNQCGVLYLALEDSLARLQDRMKKVLNGSPAPEQFYFAIKAPTIDDGLLDLFDLHFKEHPETKLVIIDTLQKVRGQSLPRESSYAQDYREMGIIKNFMDARGVTVFFVHHNRKMIDESDPFNMISGTTAIMGAADTIMIMTKDKRADQTATLHLTGRDIPQSSIVVKFDKDCWKWYPLGESDWVEAQRARKEYTDSPIVKTIKKLIEQNPKKRWDGSAKDLLNAGKLIAKLT
ncbi:DNA primase (bacterial type) [uncultured Ruminococcus sp.]|nr:DNA primase (bacterial type) [uncultured Clostridium sp.]SCI29733.1 DNA primase (bacterial type) [uncultured Ruminococcus sp.]